MQIGDQVRWRTNHGETGIGTITGEINPGKAVTFWRIDNKISVFKHNCTPAKDAGEMLAGLCRALEG